MVDLYYCEAVGGDTLIARYGDDGPEYLSTTVGMAHPNGHSELFAAQALYEQSHNLPSTEADNDQ